MVNSRIFDMSFLESNKAKMEYMVLLLIGLYIILWIPFNLMYVYLFIHAFIRDRYNILSAFSTEFWENCKLISTYATDTYNEWKILYKIEKEQSQSSGINKSKDETKTSNTETVS